MYFICSEQQQQRKRKTDSQKREKNLNKLGREGKRPTKLFSWDFDMAFVLFR